jgi:hypothetical protein
VGATSVKPRGSVLSEDALRPVVNDDRVRVWLVERTYSDGEQNTLVLVYATPDGRRYHRKERAVPGVASGVPGTLASVAVDPDQLGGVTDQLGGVTDPEERAYYADAVARTRENYEPDEAV